MPPNLYDTDTAPASPAGAAMSPDTGRRNLYDEPIRPPALTPVAVPATSWWDTAKYVGQTADDAVRAAANAVTFGMADRLAGALTPGSSTEEQVRLSEAARKRSPIASIGGDIGGAVALPGIGGRQLAARYGGGLLARALGYGAEGAVLGAAQGAGNTYSGIPSDYLEAAKSGALLGGALGAGIGGAFGPRGGMRSTAEVPTTPQLYAEKVANYNDLARSPALYEPSALAARAGDTEAALRAQRFHESRSPTSFQALDEMRGAPTAFPLGAGTPVTPGDIEFIRKGMSHLNPVTDATDIASARIVKNALDDFVRNPPPGAVIPGTEAAAAQASALAERARGNYAGYKRGQFFDDLISNAQNAAGSANSGLNLMNQLRQGARSAVRQTQGVSPASKAGYNQEEIAALRDYARGNSVANVLRYASNALGGGGGVAVPVIGGVLGGTAGQYVQQNPWMGTILGVAAPATGLALRMLGNRRANQDILELSNLIRQRTPLYQERVAAAPMAPPAGGGTAANIRDAITYEMLRQQEQ